MRNFGNTHLESSEIPFLGVIDYRHITNGNGTHYKPSEEELIAGTPFFIDGPGLGYYFENLPKISEKLQEQLLQQKESFDINSLFGIVGGYGICQYGNNIIIQQSVPFGTIKLPGGKATSKELVYALTSFRKRYTIKNTHKAINSVKNKNQIINDKYNSLSSDLKKTILSNELITKEKIHPNDNLREYPGIHTIYPLRLKAVYASTTQESISAIQEIWNDNQDFGKRFLQMQFNAIMTEQQKTLFDIKRDVIGETENGAISTNEHPKGALIRELGEETGLQGELLNDNPIAVIGEIKRSSSAIPDADKGYALKYRYLYPVKCNGVPNDELRKLSPSEIDQELSVLTNQGIVNSTQASLEYSKLKLGMSKNTIPGTDKTRIPEENLYAKTNSHIANQLLLTVGLINQYNNGRITPANMKKSVAVTLQKFGIINPNQKNK